MAKPIAPTPVLIDKEAEGFLRETDNPKPIKVSKAEVLEAKKLFESISKNLKSVKYAAK